MLRILENIVYICSSRKDNESQNATELNAESAKEDWVLVAQEPSILEEVNEDGFVSVTWCDTNQEGIPMTTANLNEGTPETFDELQYIGDPATQPTDINLDEYIVEDGTLMAVSQMAEDDGDEI